MFSPDFPVDVRYQASYGDLCPDFIFQGQTGSMTRLVLETKTGSVSRQIGKFDTARQRAIRRLYRSNLSGKANVETLSTGARMIAATVRLQEY